MKILLRLALALGLAAVPVTAVARDDGVSRIEVEAQQIPRFRVRSDKTRFGDLDYLGGIEITSPNALLGGISGFRLMPDGVRFIGVLDTGHWMTGRIERGADGRLAGLADVDIAAMRDRGGDVVQQRYYVDAEGLAIDGDTVYVSFEREHRIEQHRLEDVPQSSPVRQVPQPIPLYEFRNNRGLEALAVAPLGTPLDGALVAVSEKSLNKKGDIFAAIVTGPKKGVFFVRRHPPFDVTDGDFLPNGDLLLLERRFSLAEGVGMRIRRIAAADIKPGATVDGDILIEADLGFQIDNMESLDVFESEDGSTRILLASDDNHSLLQRSLLLEFELADQDTN
ncbi:esterase-like activity of phytase family protein [Hoeflea prorocentri]|uniref:Esterase-like activity of phytase family protein n=1 Tax=Hoeflea prorocentri TaxID=1922333 RepID=A0A9X3UNB2_9HYPH|nr:esterase-like activity of phytase family protein [Hoeflea prorocentri]MCY6383540.1 esterase-like activity of phytase family protein [Hoeflea prorocentri]MDA5401340.1 esterase-like activity of phytase family protein [Hoeflea prorocentri]